METAMKKVYEKPHFARREMLSKVTAGDGSQPIITTDG
jgi:hypothetical protein